MGPKGLVGQECFLESMSIQGLAMELVCNAWWHLKHGSPLRWELVTLREESQVSFSTVKEKEWLWERAGDGPAGRGGIVNSRLLASG